MKRRRCPAVIDRRLTQIAFMLSVVVISACVAGQTKEAARKEVVTGLDGASSQCLTLFLTRHGDRWFSESDHIKPVCIPYEKTVVSLSLEQKSGSAAEIGYRLRVTYTQPQEPPAVYWRTYWFDRHDKQGAEERLKALLDLGAVKEK
ncbi:MAG: hypothetical protein AB1641_00585 [Thermodesulfobacteriota bacterium]